MITYEYICSACQYLHQVQQNPNKFRKLKKCPQCKEKTLEQQFFAPHFSIKGEATTLSQQAERNTSKMGKYEIEARRRNDKKEIMAAKFAPHVAKGKIDADHAEKIMEDTLDKPREPFGKMSPKVKKKISTGTNVEKQAAVKKYIEKGTV